MAAGLARRGQPGVGVPWAGRAVCKLDDAQLDRLADELDRGPAAQEWADWTSDQRWTLARVAALIRRLFGVGSTLRGVSRRARPGRSPLRIFLSACITVVW